MMRCLVGAALALSLLGSAAAKTLPSSDSQVCALLSEKEAGGLLGGRPDIIDADGPDDARYCAWTIDNGMFLQTLLSVTLIDGPALGGLDAAGYFNAVRRFEASTGSRDVAGIGEAAIAIRLADGSVRVVIRTGAWVGIIDGPGLGEATVLDAARFAGARFGSVQHPLSHPAIPASCALMSLGDAAAALGHYPFVSIGDRPENQGACTWTVGMGANLTLVTREGAALAGQSPRDYIKNAALNAKVTQPIGEPDIGEEAYIAPANPRGAYFILMLLQNGRIAVLSGLGIGKDAAVQAGRAIAARL